MARQLLWYVLVIGIGIALAYTLMQFAGHPSQ